MWLQLGWRSGNTPTEICRCRNDRLGAGLNPTAGTTSAEVEKIRISSNVVAHLPSERQEVNMGY